MISDLDIYRSAKQIIDKHGDDAAAEADRRAASFLKRDDAGGHAVWRRICAADKELGRTRPTGGDSIN